MASALSTGSTGSPPSPAPPSPSSPAGSLPLSSSSFPSVNQTITIKLDDSNYLVWKMQLLNIVIANGLEGYLDGSMVCPSQFLDAGSTVPVAPIFRG